MEHTTYLLSEEDDLAQYLRRGEGIAASEWFPLYIAIVVAAELPEDKCEHLIDRQSAVVQQFKEGE